MSFVKAASFILVAYAYNFGLSVLLLRLFSVRLLSHCHTSLFFVSEIMYVGSQWPYGLRTHSSS